MKEDTDKANMDTDSIRRFYKRLNHRSYGVTELAVIDPNGSGVIATGFFTDEEAFIKACKVYNGRYNIYAGRNPRPKWLPKVCENYLDSRRRQRAKDIDIEYITAISLDIDPIRPKGTSSIEEQHKRAIGFALKLHNDIGGWVDDSGNGAYLWIPFMTPISVDHRSRHLVKGKCRLWQANIIKAYQPEKYRLRIDGCFDLSRLKKVIGTQSVKGCIHRLSRSVKVDDTMDDKVRDAILSLSMPTVQRVTYRVIPSQNVPAKFLGLLKTNQTIQQLWLTPDGNNDTSMHDWFLGSELVKAGVGANDMARVLMLNPFGKYQRDRRYDYVQTTVNKLIGGTS